jgi:2-iminobutanoate/2-iminopropanoate deaminase
MLREAGLRRDQQVEVLTPTGHFGLRQGGAEGCGTGVVHQDVQTAELAVDAIDRLLRRGLVEQVEVCRDSPPTAFAYEPSDLFDLVMSTGGDADVRSGIGKTQSYRPTNTPASPRHECPFAVEIEQFEDVHFAPPMRPPRMISGGFAPYRPVCKDALQSARNCVYTLSGGVQVGSAEFLNPEQLGPKGVAYSQGAAAGDFVFVAGQVGFDDNDQLVGPDVASQTRQALARAETVLKAAGAELTDLVQATVFLKDISDFKDFDAAWREVMGDHRPTRATVEASALIPDILVEIQGIAYRKS